MKRFAKQATLLGILLVSFHLSALPARAQAIITTYAGGLLPINGTQAITQDIHQPGSVLSDGGGGFYFTSADERVYRVAADGALTVIAGNGTTGFSGDGGPAVAAQLLNPSGLAMDAAGNLFIADSGNHRIRKITPDGIISTVAGNGAPGFSGDGGAAVSASLYSPNDVAVDGSGNVFIADSSNYRIRRITPAGIISTVAGNGIEGFSGDGGVATSVRIYYPASVAVDTAGNLFITDAVSSRIRKVTPAGIISTVAGIGRPGSSGDGGPAASAQIAYPRSVAVDAAGNLYIADSGFNRIRKVSADGIINTVAGSTFGFSGDGSPATSAQLARPSGVDVDGAGNMFIADSMNQRIRKVTPAGIIGTVAGNGAFGFSGDGGAAASAQLSYPGGVAVDRAGNVYIADTSNHRIRKVTPTGDIRTFAGTGTSGFSGDGGPATSAQLSYPASVAVDITGNVFFTDSSNHRIRKVDPAGVITTLANIATGDFCVFGTDYSDYGSSDFGRFIPPALAVDAEGNLFVADPANNRVRKVTPDGVISTVAGNGMFGFSGDGGPAGSATLFCPSGVAVDEKGNIFISDFANYRVRKVTPDGIIVTVAGDGEWGYTGDGGPAVSASLASPGGVAIDLAGNLFIVDLDNSVIRKVSPAGIISTVAGTGVYGFSGDGGPAVSAQLGSPGGIAVDAVGSLFIADTYNHRIRRVGLVLTIPTLTGVSPNFGPQGVTMNVALAGTSFVSPLTIDAGSGITVSDIRIVTDVFATATFTIASNAALGAHSLTVTTSLGTSAGFPFTVVTPFPDLTIASSHVGNLKAGFNGVYDITVVNVGTAATIGELTVTDTLPFGITFVSGSGTGWSCSASGQKVTCANLDPLEVGASTSLNLTVAIGGSAASSVTHAPAVAVAGDLISSNDSASDATSITTFTPYLQFEDTLTAGRQSTVKLTLPFAVPVDTNGTLLLAFSPDAVNPADDPAIQFATGGRAVSFTIPANTLEARFGSYSQAGPLGFQPGTVAGTLTFSGMLEAGEIHTTFSTTQIIPERAPVIQTLRTDTQNGFAVVISLLSTTREVLEVSLRFDVNQKVFLSCGTAKGCYGAGSTLYFDVKSLFNTWYAGDTELGSLSALRLPLSIRGSFDGVVWVTLRNKRGSSNSMSFPLP